MLCQTLYSAYDTIDSESEILEAIPEVIEAGLGVKEVGERCTIISIG
jgi:hypothetical protein